MPLVVTCTCGKRLQVAEEHAGKRVKCPGCQAVVTVPAKAGAPAAAAASRPAAAAPPRPAPAAAAPKPDMVRFTCPECGKNMQARAENVGRNTRCPGCQATFPIPGGAGDEPKSRVRSEPPAPKRPPQDEDEGDFGEMTQEYKTKKKRRRSAAAMNPMVLYGGLGAGALLLLVVGFIGARYMFGGGKPTSPGGPSIPVKPPALSDMALVPTEADGLFSLRQGDVWKTEVVQNGLKKLPPQTLEEMKKDEQDSGISQGDIERVTVASQGAAQAAQAQDPSLLKIWAVIRLAKPYDQKRVVDKAKFKLDDRTYQDVAYKIGTPPNFPIPLAIYFVHDQLIVAGTEPGVKAAIDVMKGPKAAGSLSPTIALIESGKHHLVIAGGIPPQAVEAARPLMKDLPPNFLALLEMKSVTLKGQVSKNLDLQFDFTYVDEAKATSARKALEGLIGLAQIGLNALKNQPGPPQPQQKEAVAQAEKILADAAPEVKGPDVILKIKVDLDALLSLVPAGPPAGPVGPGR